MSALPKKLVDRLAPVAHIIDDAGGEIVGRTKLQKTAYLLTLAGFENRFRFGYKHYGPFSEDLAEAAELAAAFELISEQQKPASWGGSYSVYAAKAAGCTVPAGRVGLAEAAAKSDAILLELAATAAYLAQEGRPKPWEETARRKPDKAAEGRLDSAKALYAELRAASDDALPEIASL
ncbi:hypothetical protein [Afifella sp. IM 167]|uniref:hypothetical protein n=1 Tax=Afifella sp. IM 167 TaxID=2033586 RepID=UPI001CC8EEEA|nr:hypothetical protein [Afifella sp. IM 167]